MTKMYLMDSSDALMQKEYKFNMICELYSFKIVSIIIISMMGGEAGMIRIIILLTGHDRINCFNGFIIITFLCNLLLTF